MSRVGGVQTIDSGSKPRRSNKGQSKSVNKISKLDNSIFGAITNKTTAQDSNYEGTVMDSGSVTMSGATPYPNYFFKPEDNLFSPIKQTGEKFQIKAFHLTQPDERLAKHLFSQQAVKPKEPFRERKDS